MFETRIEIRDAGDRMAAWEAGREIADIMRLSARQRVVLLDDIRALTRVLLECAGGGSCILRGRVEEESVRLEVEIEGVGDALSELALALDCGRGWGDDMGMELLAAKCLSDGMFIEPSHGHTRVRLALTQGRNPPAGWFA